MYQLSIIIIMYKLIIISTIIITILAIQILLYSYLNKINNWDKKYKN